MKITRKQICAPSVILFLLCAPVAAQDYLRDAEAVPLMPGLSENEDKATRFDKPSGRVVLTEAFGVGARADLQKFYAASLPNLGWRQMGELAYVKEGERLTIEVEEDNGLLLVSYRIVPLAE